MFGVLSRLCTYTGGLLISLVMAEIASGLTNSSAAAADDLEAAVVGTLIVNAAMKNLSKELKKKNEQGSPVKKPKSSNCQEIFFFWFM